MMGAACIIRPIELIWVLPWWLWALHGLDKARRRELFYALATFLFLLGIFFGLNHVSYAAWWRIGYWLRDNPTIDTKSVLYQISQPHLFPFGLHPRNILWNIKSFLESFLWPYVTIGACAIIYLIYREKFFKQRCDHAKLFLGASLWTVLVLLLIYGSGLYQDHVKIGTVTVANSFLRYLLPLMVLAGVAASHLVAHLHQHVYSKAISTFVTTTLVIFGVYGATFRDEEGVCLSQPSKKQALD
jgi:hypothetical protein